MSMIKLFALYITYVCLFLFLQGNLFELIYLYIFVCVPIVPGKLAGEKSLHIEVCV